MTRFPLLTAAMLTAASLCVASTATAVAPPVADAGVGGQLATFEGRTFDMSLDWGAATACHVADNGVSCYRSEAEMDKAVRSGSGGFSMMASCSSSLRLYDGTGYTGQVISISTRSTLISLSGYGFDNKTSSYRVGACAARLYSGIGTSQYGGNTSAFAAGASMAAGWNNVMSSVIVT